MPIGRRQFLSSSGGALFCTLAGHHLTTDSHVDLHQLAAGVPVPPKVLEADRRADGAWAAGAGSTTEFVDTQVPAGTPGLREYWIQAEKVKWDIVPTHHDQMMDQKVSGNTRFTALAYRRYSPNFGHAWGPATIPGPLISGYTGDTMVIHFRNATGVPVTMHPHGIFYTDDMDGTYKGKYTDVGGFVENGRTFTYVWQARAGTEGFWLYHDHGPLDPVPVFKGLFGPLLIRPTGQAPPDQEYFIVLHAFSPVATNLDSNFSCINGRAYAGNTPTLTSKVGNSVKFHVIALDNDFHTFHLHGHRWTDPGTNQVIDTKTLGPAESYTASFTEDNPGRWFYHCHVFSHLHMGMNGWYIVSG
jgi:FtsP/CotA-like multicopper oxidase with cupredoxin domain